MKCSPSSTPPTSCSRSSPSMPRRSGPSHGQRGLAAIGYPPTKLAVILNRADARGVHEPEEVEEVLGQHIDFEVVSDGRLVLAANNEGAPFVAASPTPRSRRASASPPPPRALPHRPWPWPPGRPPWSRPTTARSPSSIRESAVSPSCPRSSAGSPANPPCISATAPTPYGPRPPMRSAGSRWSASTGCSRRTRRSSSWPATRPPPALPQVREHVPVPVLGVVRLGGRCRCGDPERPGGGGGHRRHGGIGRVPGRDR